MTNIIVTDAAVSKFLSITENDSESELNLRVFVTGGGCNGFSYGFTMCFLKFVGFPMVLQGFIQVYWFPKVLLLFEY